MTARPRNRRYSVDMSAADASTHRHLVQWIGLILGPLLAVGCYYLLSDGDYTHVVNGQEEIVHFGHAGRATLAAMVWMGVWWLTEAIDISATALFPIALFPVFGIATIVSVCAPYASQYIFLFLGGFLLALSMQRWGLDRRIAMITLRIVGTKPVNMVGGFMVATAVMSAFVSNTATTAMMLPIALSVIVLVQRTGVNDDDSPRGRHFALCLMLGVAYAASIGGISTIIGTPPNVFLAGFISDTIDPAYQRDIGFLEWMGVGVPLAAVFLPITWVVLTRVIYPIDIKQIEGGRALIDSEYRALGPMSRGEWATFIVFIITAIAWIVRPILANGLGAEVDPATGEVIGYMIPPILPGLSDAGIAMIGGMSLFLIPIDAGRRVFAMNWETARKLPWGILILFGGGLTLAAAVKENHVAVFIGAQAEMLANWPTLLLVIIVIAGIIFLTELTSNTATTATLVPVLAALAIGLQLHPFMLIVPAAIAASCAFMMPVATPPNAIVFGSGHITIPQMCRAGLWLNLIGIVLVTVLTYLIAIPLLGISGG